ncbi:MAG TPA: hypothetical protein VGX25_03530 [Actinophytocola sp.]|nr:hypothetical protein [Actinophytocola sp.]HEV2778449.1 hypothetical protein [Actinophytocola sp.]
MRPETLPSGRSGHSPPAPGAIVERYWSAVDPVWVSLVAHGSVDGS